MRVRFPVICALLALALPAAALAAPVQPNRSRMVANVPPGAQVALTIGPVPAGEFAFSLRVSSDGAKAFRLTQQRIGGRRFVVLRSPGAVARDACRGAAGTLLCTGITTPATPGRRRWTFAFTNTSGREMAIAVTIVRRRVQGAG